MARQAQERLAQRRRHAHPQPDARLAGKSRLHADMTRGGHIRVDGLVEEPVVHGLDLIDGRRREPPRRVRIVLTAGDGDSAGGSAVQDQPRPLRLIGDFFQIDAAYVVDHTFQLER